MKSPTCWRKEPRSEKAVAVLSGTQKKEPHPSKSLLAAALREKAESEKRSDQLERLKAVPETEP